MIHHPKKITILSLVSIAVVFIAATIGPYKKYKNLQVLPQDISQKQLDSIMNAYTRALKVSCEFCHVKPKKDMFNINPAVDTLDFSLDNNMKEDARKMIRMTIDINKKYFYFDSTRRPEYLNVVSCNTCHRGNPSPMHE